MLSISSELTSFSVAKLLLNFPFIFIKSDSCWIIAVDALRAYVRGESDEYPDAPPHGPGGTLDADWNTWTRIAE